MSPELVLKEWQSEFDLSQAQANLLQMLYQRRMSTPNTPLRMSKQELDVLREQGEAGFDASRRLLESIGISI